MLYAVYELNGVEVAGVFDCCADYFTATFDPEVEIVGLIEFKAKGKTYQDRKQYVRDQAINYSYLRGHGSLSWGEVAEIEHYFETYGRRYGLLKEFREEAIC